MTGFKPPTDRSDWIPTRQRCHTVFVNYGTICSHVVVIVYYIKKWLDWEQTNWLLHDHHLLLLFLKLNVTRDLFMKKRSSPLLCRHSWEIINDRHAICTFGLEPIQQWHWSLSSSSLLSNSVHILQLICVLISLPEAVFNYCSKLFFTSRSSPSHAQLAYQVWEETLFSA